MARRLRRQTRQGHGLWPGIGGWGGLGARPLARCCARGLWPGTQRSGLGPGFDATASGQVLGAAASGSDATQRLRARVGRFLSHSWRTASGQALPKPGPLPHQPRCPASRFSGANACTARPDGDTASGQVLVVGGSWAHGLWQGVARTASGQVRNGQGRARVRRIFASHMRSAALGQVLPKHGPRLRSHCSPGEGRKH